MKIYSEWFQKGIKAGSKKKYIFIWMEEDFFNKINELFLGKHDNDVYLRFIYIE